jgi:hypothetical protein
MSQMSLAQDELSSIWVLGSQFSLFGDKSFPLQALLREPAVHLLVGFRTESYPVACKVASRLCTKLKSPWSG